VKKLNLSIVIPTRNRSRRIISTLKFLRNNAFFFKEIIIVDSSDSINKISNKILFQYRKLNIKLVFSNPSISLQRNIGLAKVNKKTTYVMFLDDDISFKKNSLKKMYYFIKSSKFFNGLSFNLIMKNQNTLMEQIKKSGFFKFLGVYDNKLGVVTNSGWQTKAINLKENQFVEWLPTQAVIYNYKIIKNKKFDLKYGTYSYLEDLDFSYRLRKDLIIYSKAKYSSNNIINRDPLMFGIKEIVNRHRFVKKFNFSLINFYFGCIFLIIKHFLSLLSFKPKYLLRIIGNIHGLLKIFFNKANGKNK
tara:strand:+ start:50 stop:961 length:912 start_codon:yes stop_codon:yes gene_type:complete